MTINNRQVAENTASSDIIETGLKYHTADNCTADWLVKVLHAIAHKIGHYRDMQSWSELLKLENCP